MKIQLHPEVEYVVDVDNGMCTCSLGWNGQPTGEPCCHQAAVGRKYTINVTPTFNVDGRFLFAQFAVGKEEVLNRCEVQTSYQRYKLCLTLQVL